MKLIGMMMARNEDWIIGLSLRAALAWCDEMIVMLHRCSDETVRIVTGVQWGGNGEAAAGDRPSACSGRPEQVGDRVTCMVREEDPWPEMALRQEMLDYARALGATHLAIIDADEVLTGNLLKDVRPWIEALAPGKLLELPMIPAWRSLHEYRDDRSVWSRSFITLAVGASEALFYRSRDGYEFHNRPPGGSDLADRVRPFTDKRCGGVFHLQFADWDRLMWKHTQYKMQEVLRWPGREPAAAVDRKYERALDERDLAVRAVPAAWWDPYRPWLDCARLGEEPWQKAECRRLYAEHGPERFSGLRLRGLQ
jgi:hypothetical protein